MHTLCIHSTGRIDTYKDEIGCVVNTKFAMLHITETRKSNVSMREM
jgi:hypothetical protein